MDAKTKKLLVSLADKYETADFVTGDPSQILRKYKKNSETEVASFVMALLSFGQREQFLKKADLIFSLCGTSPFEWLKSGAWQKDFPRGQKKFYRFYSFDDVRDVFSVLQKILNEHKTFGLAVKSAYEKVLKNCDCDGGCGASGKIDLAAVISKMFTDCAMVPQTKTTANKRVNMFLRWMVRKNSPVDLGVWTWFSARDLVIPLDTHVLQVAKKLGLLPENAGGTLKTAEALTEVLREAFPNDPVRGDFALFGAGVDKT